MFTDALMEVNQIPADVVTEGEEEMPNLSLIGQVFTADWRMRLLMAGKLFRLSVGTVSTSTGLSRVTGGGSGDVIDLDEPQIIIGVPSGYRLIPVEVHVSGVLDLDAGDELGEILVTMDRTNNCPAATATVATLYNLLDGGEAFAGIAAHTVTSAITDPTNEEILAIETIRVSDFVSNATGADKTNGVVQKLQLDWQPEVPSIAEGPCSMCVYWGGTAAVTALATVVVGCVPNSWFAVT